MNTSETKNKIGLFLKKRKEYTSLDYFLIDIALVATTLILLKIFVPYSLELIFNTGIWWFICLFSAAVVVILITNLRREIKKVKGKG